MDNDPTVKAQNNKRRSVPQVILGFAIVSLSAVGLAGLVDRTPERTAGTARTHAVDRLLAGWAGPVPALAQVSRHRIHSRTRCAECGVIESTVETEAHENVAFDATASASAIPSTRRLITVRLADGSRRVIDDASAAQWRPRQRVIVIGGMTADR